MSATVKYKGNIIASLSENETKTLKTSGKYCEGDIVVENVKDSGITKVKKFIITVPSETRTAIEVVIGDNDIAQHYNDLSAYCIAQRTEIDAESNIRHYAICKNSYYAANIYGTYQSGIAYGTNSFSGNASTQLSNSETIAKGMYITSDGNLYLIGTQTYSLQGTYEIIFGWF